MDKNTSRNIDFLLNAILHILILLLIIGTFFFTYVSGLSKDKFEGELSDLINNNLGPAIVKADKNKVLKNILKTMNLDQISQFYSKPDRASVIQNEWLTWITIIAICVVFCTMILVIVILYVFSYDTPLLYILRENAIVFALIGTTEILFFFYIAKKYIPTKPSLMIQTVIERLKNDF